MTDQQSIFNAIDGEAQRYIDYGFIEGVKQTLQQRRRGYSIFSFQTKARNKNAQNLFERFFPTSPELISQKNPIVVIDHSLSSGYQILYTKPEHFAEDLNNGKIRFRLEHGQNKFYWNIDKKIGTGQ